MLKLFYQGKYLRKEEKNSLAPICNATLSIVLCMVCLAGTSWAWFTASQATPVAPIVSAQWDLESIQVYQLAGDAAAAEPDGGWIPVEVTVAQKGASFTAEADTPYAVKVSVKGNASSGFLKIDTCDGVYYAVRSPSSFSLLLSQDGAVTVSASWGKLPEEAVSVADGMLLGNGAMETDTAEAAEDPETTE